MRLYRYNSSGIEITDAIRDSEPVGIIMKDNQIFKPDFLNSYGYGSFRKAILFVGKNSSYYRLEIY